MRRVFLPLLVFVIAGLTACGSDGGPQAPDVVRTEETAGKLPKLPRGFEPYENRTTGVAFGRPPGWKVTEKNVLTVIRAPDELVVTSVAVDRTDEALAEKPRSLAVETAKLLPGYRKPLRPTKPEPFAHPYAGAAVEAEGVATDGLEQRVKVIVLKREGAAVVIAVVAENAEVGAPAEVRQALDAVASLRTQPIG